MTLDPVVVHRIFGAVVLGFSGVVFIREINVLKQAWAEWLPAAALMTAGLLLVADPWLFHGGDYGMEGRQHVVLGLIAIVAGGLEGWRLHRQSRFVLTLLAVPAAIAVLGIAFLWHQQHDAGDMLTQTAQHRVMGATLLVAASLKLVANLRPHGASWARSGWPLVLIVFSLQLFLYVENRKTTSASFGNDQSKMSHAQFSASGEKQ